MSSSRKAGKRVATTVGEWLPHPQSGLYYRYYTDENGQEQVQWSEPETPRSDYVAATAHTQPSNEADVNNDDYGDDAASYTTSRGDTVHQGAGGYSQDISEEDLVSGVEDLSVGEDYGDVEGHHQAQTSLATHDYEDVQSSHHHRTTTTAPAAGVSKGKTVDKKSSKSHDKKSSSSKPKKEHKSSSDKKGKGKGKDTRPQDEPDEPFYAPGQSSHAPLPQQPSHRAPRQRQRPHQPAPTGGTGGASPDDSQPVDGTYGARSTASVDPETGYYAPAGHPRVEDEAEQDQMEIPNEINDVNIPTDAGFDPGFLPHEEEEDDQALQHAIQASRGAYNLGSGDIQNAYGPGFERGESSYAPQDAYEPINEEGGDGDITPTRDNPRLEPDDIIRGTQGSYEPIDARYRVEPSHKFQPGEVFKILWSEPQGQSSRVDIETYTERMHLENDWGERFYVGFRRFIVVANDEGHCTCVPILTYIRQGCKKKGAKPAKHGIVYESTGKPRLIEGEPKLGFRPIRMEIKASGERLARESRVNYSKLVTVEHNVKVFFIGNINLADFENIVRGAVDRCWQDKIRRRMDKQLATVRA